MIAGVIAAAHAQAPAPDWIAAHAPAAQTAATLAHDLARQRTVLFLGAPAVGRQPETWEWDGIVWMRRWPLVSPTSRLGQAMAYDAARRVTVMFGGRSTAGQQLDDVWEWDGSNWSGRTAAVRPPARRFASVAYDLARQRTVLFGGRDDAQTMADTWEWDGTAWNARPSTAAPPPRSLAAMTYDLSRQVVVLFGGEDVSVGRPRSIRGDTWEWNGTSWRQHAPLANPPARQGSQMVCDWVRQRIVLFGGNDGAPTPSGGQNFRDTWEWDGSNWSLVSATVAPPASWQHAMTYDVARQRTLVWGGVTAPVLSVLGEMWSFDGSSWVGPLPGSSPPTRSATAVAFDQARRRLVLFGGLLLGPGSADTWEWDGAAWTLRATTSAPGGRIDHGLAYDAARQRTVCFGGTMTGGLSAETWEWDGTTWNLQQPAVAPAGRSGHALCFDTARGRVVMFGGLDGQAALRDETWEWNGTSWTLNVPATRPAPRRAHALAFDESRQRVVLFGGNGSSGPLNDTWEYDGSTWTRISPPVAPSARAGHAMAWDGTGQRVLLMGGSPPGYADDVWAWDGSTWSRVTTATMPGPHSGHAMAYDTARSRVVLFGGGLGVADTWLFGPLVPATVTAFGSPCGGAGAAPRLTTDATPHLGTPGLRLDLSTAHPSAACLFGLAATTQSIGIGGCTLYLGGLPVGLFAAADAGGVASASLPIPLDVSLRSAQVFAQAFVVDPQVPPIGVAFSAALRLTLGD